MSVPNFDDLFNPLLQAIRELGGSASIQEQIDKVVTILNLSEKDVNEQHRGNRTKLDYRLAWARNYLKRYGLLDNSARGIWVLTQKGFQSQIVDKEIVKKFVQTLDKTEIKEDSQDSGVLNKTTSWQNDLLDVIQKISPQAFERLCQRMLRESGFIQVEITGQTGDGGIDGKGIVKVGGLISFHVIFQCKRYKENVSATIVRDFRGAMVGRADKGLIITTSGFTRDARKEAQRDGAPPIDLIDGESLAEKLKELEIGIDVRKRIVEDIAINKSFFENL
jgi:restriction system protein